MPTSHKYQTKLKAPIKQEEVAALNKEINECLQSLIGNWKISDPPLADMIDEHMQYYCANNIIAQYHYRQQGESYIFEYSIDTEPSHVALTIPVAKKTKSYANVSLDIEVLGLNNDAVIMEIALTFFDENGIGDTKEYRINWREQQNRSTDLSTISFWLKLPKEKQEVMTNSENRISLQEALLDIARTITKDQFVWAKSPSFDCAILKNAMQQFCIECPWDFRKERDYRTLVDMCNVNISDIVNRASHTAAGDAEYQARVLSRILLSQSALSNTYRQLPTCSIGDDISYFRRIPSLHELKRHIRLNGRKVDIIGNWRLNPKELIFLIIEVDIAYANNNLLLWHSRTVAEAIESGSLCVNVYKHKNQLGDINAELIKKLPFKFNLFESRKELDEFYDSIELIARAKKIKISFNNI